MKYPPVSAGSTLMSTIRSSPVLPSRNGGRMWFNAYDRPLTSVRTGVRYADLTLNSSTAGSRSSSPAETLASLSSLHRARLASATVT
eukprot:1745913-Alexandrium_andersonii.AAC.1